MYGGVRCLKMEVKRELEFRLAYFWMW